MGLSVKKAFKGIKKAVKKVGQVYGAVGKVTTPLIVGAVTGGNPLAVAGATSAADVIGDALEGKSLRKKNFGATLKKGALAGGTAALGNVIRGAGAMGGIGGAPKPPDVDIPYVDVMGSGASASPASAGSGGVAAALGGGTRVPAPQAVGASHALDYLKAGAGAAQAGLNYLGESRAAAAQERATQAQVEAERRRQLFEETKYFNEQKDEKDKREAMQRFFEMILPQYGVSLDDLRNGKLPTFPRHG